MVIIPFTHTVKKENVDKKHKDILKAWKNLAAENSATKKMFVESTYVNRGKEITKHSFQRKRVTSGIYYLGIDLKTNQQYWFNK